jgi:arsenate reductase (thioredoxin)
MNKSRVLILCTGNSARSQMAEGLLRELGHGQIEVHSAGTKPSVLNPLAIRAMSEAGIDISQQRSKHLDEFRAQPFDTVITVCDDAAEACPVFPGRAERIHWSIPDPAALQGTEEKQLAAFRAARDQLEAHLREWMRRV